MIPKKLLLTVLAACCSLAGAPVAQSSLFKTYGIADGLAQSQVFDLWQCRRGYLWCATLGGGVSRFDGRRFATFTTRDGLASNIVDCIAEDAQTGRLYFGTERGLSCFDGMRFSTIATDRLPDQDISSLLVDRNGRLWIGTSHGFATYDGAEVTTLHPILSDKKIYSIDEDRSGSLWLGTSAGVFRATADTVTRVRLGATVDTTSVFATREDRAGRRWFATLNGLVQLDGDQVRTFSVADGLPGQRIRDVMEDREGRLWIGTESGLATYEGGVFRSLTTADGLGSDTIYDLLADREGIVWIGTYRGGLSRWVGRRFQHFTSADGLSGDIVRSIVRRRNGELWFGTSKGGACTFDGVRFRRPEFVNRLVDEFVLAILEDADERMWFGTLRGLSRYDGSRVDSIGSELSEFMVRALARDPSGRVWIGTDQRGLLSHRAGKLRTHAAADGFDRDSVMSLHTDRSGRLWLGTDSGVLIHHDGTFTDLSERFGLVGTSVLAIAEDGAGQVWLGTYGKGVLRVSTDRSSVESFGSAIDEAMTPDAVVSLSFDDAEDLWVGTEIGVFHLGLSSQPGNRTMMFRHFGLDDGFPGVECIHGAALKDESGALWFGTTNGVARFDPRDLRPRNSSAPLVHITDVQFGDQAAAEFGAGTDPKTLLPIDVHVPSDQNRVTFDFQALSMAVPEKVRYRFRLVGMEEEWSEPHAGRRATYTKLGPGEYSFEVIACNNDGIWTKTPSRFHFQIRCPFWMTWWFYLIASVGSLAILYSVVSLRARSIAQARSRTELESRVEERTAELAIANTELHEEIRERKRLELELMQAARNETIQVVAGGIAHDFNNLLTTVFGAISRAKIRAEKDEDLQLLLADAEQAAQRTRNLTRQLQALSKGGVPIERTSIPTAAIVRETCRLALGESDCTAEIEIADDIQPIYGDEGQISQVIHNLVLNAAQAMPGGGVVTIRCANSRDDSDRSGGDWVTISVTDQGTGIPANALGRIFEPYITTKPTGQGLGLATAQRIVHTHGGEITVESTLGVGTSIRVRLPAFDSNRRLDYVIPRPGPLSGHILVVDDQVEVREMTKAMLETLGLTVDVAADDREALVRFTKSKTPGAQAYDAVVLDLTLPGELSGLDILEGLRRIDADVAAMVFSGYSDDPVMADYRSYGFHAALPKPFTLDELALAIRAVLQPPTPSKTTEPHK